MRARLIRFWWDTDSGNDGWYVEVLDNTGNTITDSMKVDFPIDVDDFDMRDSAGLTQALKEEFPGTTIETP